MHSTAEKLTNIDMLNTECPSKYKLIYVLHKLKTKIPNPINFFIKNSFSAFLLHHQKVPWLPCPEKWWQQSRQKSCSSFQEL